MNIRCRECHAVVWAEPVERPDGKDSLTCGECGQTYVLEVPAFGGEKRLGGPARRIAKQEGLDLPGAYSVLLEIATVEEMRELGSAGSTSCRTAPRPQPAPATPAGPAPAGGWRYDKKFQPAIDAGTLTYRQAAERGDRNAFAGILSSKHRLPMEIAYDIADNRISLLDAIRQRTRNEGELQAEQRTSTRRSALFLCALALVALFGWVTRDTGVKLDDSNEEVRRLIGDAEVRTSSDGMVLQVSGPDPRSVLRAYCAASGRAGRLEPLDVAPSSAPGVGRARVGLLRDPYRPDDLLSITIREDREGGRWIAGDGVHPLIADPAPTGSELAVRRR